MCYLLGGPICSYSSKRNYQTHQQPMMGYLEEMVELIGRTQETVVWIAYTTFYHDICSYDNL